MAKFHAQTAEILNRRSWTVQRAGRFWLVYADFAEPVMLTRAELEPWIFNRDRDLAYA